MRRRYRYNPETRKMEEITGGSSRLENAGPLTDAIKPFKSPIDGSLIKSRRDLAQHNKRYGVTNDLDSLREKTQQHRQRMQTPYVGTREERIKEVVKAFDFISQNKHLFNSRD